MEAKEATTMTLLERMDAEVQMLTDERSADLLPLLYVQMIEREGLEPCKRHRMLRERVRAEIALTRANRYFRYDSSEHSSHVERLDQDTSGDPRHWYSGKSLDKVLERTLRVRKKYRSHPCTCWVTHR